MKGDQLMSQTFLSADHHHLSSSEQWELDRHGPHTWTLRFGPLTPPGYSGDGQSWDALQRWKRARKWTHSSPSIMFFLIELKLWFHKKKHKKISDPSKKNKKNQLKINHSGESLKTKKEKKRQKQSFCIYLNQGVSVHANIISHYYSVSSTCQFSKWVFWFAFLCCSPFSLFLVQLPFTLPYFTR